jgi:hypothetical protein
VLTEQPPPPICWHGNVSKTQEASFELKNNQNRKKIFFNEQCGTVKHHFFLFLAVVNTMAGSGCSTYRVQHKGKTTVAKTFPTLEAAEAEMACLAILCHPNVIRPSDFVWGLGLIAIFMPALDMDLKQFTETAEYGPIITAEIFRQLACAVNHIHSHGILIIDIKLSNVAVSYEMMRCTLAGAVRSLEIRMIDFGSSKLIADVKTGEEMRFTNECQCPEKKDGIFDFPGDIWEFAYLIQQVINRSQDKEQSERKFGDLVNAMTSVDSALRPTAWQVRRFVDRQRLEFWEKLDFIWSSKAVFEPDLNYITKAQDPLTFLARNFSDRMIFITKLARGGSLRNINKAFFFLYKTAQGQESSGQMGAGFRDRIMLQISEFHAVVGDSWWTQLLYCMTIRSLCSVLPPIALPQSVEDLLRALSSVEVCKAYVREALDLALASAAPIDAEPAAKKRKRSADTA